MSVPPSALTRSTITPSRHGESAMVQDEIERTTWYDFAAILLFFVGTMNVIAGIAAVRDSRALSHSALFSSIHAWGWFFLIWGAIQILAAFAVYKGASWGIWAAVITAFANAVAQLADARTMPIWSITIVVLDVVIIYGLIIHSGRRSRTVT
jgi:hypothetical protein